MRNEEFPTAPQFGMLNSEFRISAHLIYRISDFEFRVSRPLIPGVNSQFSILNFELQPTRPKDQEGWTGMKN